MVPTKIIEPTMAIDIPELLKSIQNQKCALVLGPNACLTSDGKTTFAQVVAKKIQESLPAIKYYENSDLYHVPSRVDRTKACEIIQENATLNTQDPLQFGFYTSFFQQLSELPFHLILSLSPDKFLYSWMKYQGLSPQFAHFHVNKPTDKFDAPDINKPLIFNLFGDVDKAESLILTQEDFYRYLTDIFTNSKKLEDLRTTMHEINYLLFLGFPLDRWYVQLLMLLMDINSDSRYIAFATNPKKDNIKLPIPLQANNPELLELEDFCGKHFKIAFAEQNFLELTQLLYDQAKANQQMIRLRALKPVKTPQKSIIPLDQKQVAISYAQDEKSVLIAEKLTQHFSQKGYTVLNEKITLSYRGNVGQFIEKMSAGQAVIVILSDKYLKDKNCMNLALQMEKYPHPQERIFPIVLEDAKILDVVERISYLNFWDKEKTKINEALANLPDQSYTRSVQSELDLCSEIRRFLDRFIGFINNMNYLTPDIHENENFTSLFDAVETRFTSDEQPIAP